MRRKREDSCISFHSSTLRMWLCYYRCCCSQTLMMMCESHSAWLLIFLPMTSLLSTYTFREIVAVNGSPAGFSSWRAKTIFFAASVSFCCTTNRRVFPLSRFLLLASHSDHWNRREAGLLIQPTREVLWNQLRAKRAFFAERWSQGKEKLVREQVFQN